MIMFLNYVLFIHQTSLFAPRLQISTTLNNDSFIIDNERDSVLKTTISNVCGKLRLDSFTRTFLQSRNITVSRSFIDELCGSHKIFVNGKPKKKSCSLKFGDEIVILNPNQNTQEHSDSSQISSLSILYEDENIIAVNKPSGMIVHPVGKPPFTNQQTFLHHLLNHLSLPTVNIEYYRQLLIHRLDKATTGVLLAGKTVHAAQSMRKLFAERKILKIYATVCIGNPGDAVLKQLVVRSINKRMKMRVETALENNDAKEATTYVKSIKSNGRFSIALVRILTGRTHQIRVHLQHRGSPVLGDVVYGCKDKTFSIKKYPLPLLHARKISFNYPFSPPGEPIQRLEIEAPFQKYFIQKIGEIFNYSVNLEDLNVTDYF